jgi:hypothetical protein
MIVPISAPGVSIRGYMMRLRIGVILLLILISLLSRPMPVLSQDGDKLTETYYSIDGMLSFHYPEGWAVRSTMPGMVEVSSDPDQQVSDDEAGVPPGVINMGIITPPISLLLFEETPTTLEEATEQVILLQQEMLEADESTLLSAPETLIINGHPAVRFDGTSDLSDGLVVVIEFDGEFVMITTEVAPGTFGDYEDTVFAILDTMSYRLPEGLLPFTSENDSLTLRYPPGWVTLEMIGMVALANAYDAVQFQSTALAPGSIMLFVYQPEAYLMLFEPQDITATALEIAQMWVTDETPGSIGEPMNITIGDRKAVRVDFMTENEAGFVIALEFDGTIIPVLVRGTVNALADTEATALPILESIQYTAPEE